MFNFCRGVYFFQLFEVPHSILVAVAVFFNLFAVAFSFLVSLLSVSPLGVSLLGVLPLGVSPLSVLPLIVSLLRFSLLGILPSTSPWCLKSVPISVRCTNQRSVYQSAYPDTPLPKRPLEASRTNRRILVHPCQKTTLGGMTYQFATKAKIPFMI